MGAPRYLRLESAAQKYGVSTETLLRAAESGLVRAVRINGFIAVAEDDVKRLENRNGHSAREFPRYISLSEAARRYGISEEVLKRAIESGTIEAIYLDEEVAVAEGDVEKIVIRKSDFDHLRGSKIGIAEAARKYGLTPPTVSRWVRLGYIRKIGRQGQKVLIDEADVAYCATIYRLQGGGQGKRIFDQDGKPYQPKTRREKPVPRIIVVS